MSTETLVTTGSILHSDAFLVCNNNPLLTIVINTTMESRDSKRRKTNVGDVVVDASATTTRIKTNKPFRGLARDNLIQILSCLDFRDRSRTRSAHTVLKSIVDTNLPGRVDILRMVIRKAGRNSKIEYDWKPDMSNLTM